MTKTMPLKLIGPSRHKTRKTPDGWIISGHGDGQGVLSGFAEPLICRIRLPEDGQVVQLGIGSATSLLCNAVYSRKLDAALWFEAAGLELAYHKNTVQVKWRGSLRIGYLADFYRVHHAMPLFARLDRKAFPTAPAGWGSWYEYYLEVSEEEIRKNADWLAKNLQDFGCEYLQIDDGWQDKGTGWGMNRNWLTTASKFPHGMKKCADYIRAKGFKPGIWLLPFGQSDVTWAKANDRLLLKKPDGRSVGERDNVLTQPELKETEKAYDWIGRFQVDPTSPDMPAYFRRLFTMLCKEWGYDMVKIDGQGGVANLLRQYNSTCADRSADPRQAYRRAVGVMKKSMGAKSLLLNCGAGWETAGLCEAIRIGGDVDLRTGWAGMLPAIEGTMRWLFLNTIMFYTDPDCVCVREPLPMNLATLWAALVGLTGQTTFASDAMYKLPDQRVELLRRIFPVANIHPMELYPLNAQRPPAIFNVKVNLPNVGKWDVLGCFNWNGTDNSKLDINPARLGLPAGKYLAVDPQNQTVVHDGDGVFSVEVPPQSVKLVGLYPKLNHPQVVGTSRHITQGAVDLVEVVWEARRNTLSGISNIVKGDPYRIRIHVPHGYRMVGHCESAGSLSIHTINPTKTGRLRWSIKFSRA